MKMKHNMMLVLVVSIMALTGCGTLMSRQYPSCRPDPNYPYYSATTWDVFTITTGGGLFVCPIGGGHLPSYVPVMGWLVIVPLHVMDLPISLVTDTIFLPSDHHYRANQRIQEAEAAETVRMVSMIRESPQIVLDRDWHLSEDPIVTRAVEGSIADTNTPYTAEMLETMFSEAPRYRDAILAHPACPTRLLVDNFQEAFDKSRMFPMTLVAILKNPNTPIELLEKVSRSRCDQNGFAEDILKRRQAKGQTSGQPTGPCDGVPAAHDP